jgi:hypothetical protein
MRSTRSRTVRYIVACAAVAGQFLAAIDARACERSCGAAVAMPACCPLGFSSDRDIAPECPLCTAEEVGQDPVKPCRCDLESRDDAAMPAKARSAVDHRQPARDVGPGMLAVAEQASGAAMRQAVAEGATIPRRPPRIVFGVWRN